MTRAALVAAAAFILAASSAETKEAGANPQHHAFITLGTAGGPIPHPHRSQPANALVRGAETILIDVGDGAAEQLARAGASLQSVRAIFISHLHFDHTGGLAAILGLRYQTNAPGVLTVYGPPGTARLVDGLVASMQPAAEAGYGFEGQKQVRPADTVRAVEIVGGARLTLGDVHVTAAQNTHYSFPSGSPGDKAYKSLAFRFDLPDRSIVYTGDTGPSADVEALAKGADLLVSEMIDVGATLEVVRRNSPAIDASTLEGVARHLTVHHLSPVQVGELAARAEVKRVVATHLVLGAAGPAALARYKEEIASRYKGEITIARDLDRF
jgi:ribonuclease BN (tRNA processing enzyme)